MRALMLTGGLEMLFASVGNTARGHNLRKIESALTDLEIRDFQRLVKLFRLYWQRMEPDVRQHFQRKMILFLLEHQIFLPAGLLDSSES